MTDQPAALFVLWLDASDGSIPTCDGIRWPDGTATVHHRHFAGMTSTHASPEAAAWAAHGKQARIVWPDASERPEPAPACDHRCSCGHDQQDHSARYCGRCADPCNSSGHYPDDCDARTTPENPATSSDTADNPDDPLRHQIFGIALDNLIRFHGSLLHPSTVAVDIADAVIGVRDTELQQLRADLAAETALRHERTELYDAWRGKANELGGVIARVRVTNLCGDCKINVRAALDGPADTTPPAAPQPTHGGNIGWTEPTVDPGAGG